MADQNTTEPKRCPFDDPQFTMDPKKPCPVCGDLGTLDTIDEPSHCIAGKPAGKEKHA